MEDGIFVSNIKTTIDEKALRSFFNQFGLVTDLNLQPDKFNDETKVCYIKFSTTEAAAKSVKLGDKSLHFGEPLRVSFKKFTERQGIKLNGVNRMQSFGRGRGALLPTMLPPGAPSFVSDIVYLRDLDLKPERKLVVEVVELKSLSNILVRPLFLTEKYRATLATLLEQINQNPERLMNVRNVEVDQFYLAKWTTDNQYYRAKILSKTTDNKFKVCFVDEGTSGDIVTELRAIPQNIIDFPSQFLSCTANCEDSPELIDLVLQEGSTSEVSICPISISKVMNKCLVSIFVGGKNIIDIFKTKYAKDPRSEKTPGRRDIAGRQLGTTLSDCKLSKDPQNPSYIILTSSESIQMHPKLHPLDVCPITNDLLVYREPNGNLYRCAVESVQFENNRINYSVYLIDENRLLNTFNENLLKCSLGDIDFPSKVLRGVLKSVHSNKDSRLFQDSHSVKLVDYDSRKDLYVFDVIVQSNKVATVTATAMATVAEAPRVAAGQIKTVVISHVESIHEFYAQFCDGCGLQTLDNIQSELNTANNRLVRIGSIKDVRCGELVMAPFQEVNYRARVLTIDQGKQAALLHFVDYGNCEWVEAALMYRLPNSAVVGVAPLAHRCKLSCADCVVNGDSDGVAMELLREYCEHGDCEVHMKVNECCSQGGGGSGGVPLLSVSVTGKNKRTFADILESRGLLARKEAEKKAERKTESPLKLALRKRIEVLENKVALLERQQQMGM